MAWDLAEAVIGSLFVAIGLMAVAAALTARPRRDPMPLWFGTFALLYGVRLGARSTLIWAATPVPQVLFHYADAFVTYGILIAAGLFVEALVGPGWHALVRRAWQVTCVYACAAAVNDIVRGRPYASMWLNAPVVLLTLLVQVPHVVARARGSRWSADAVAVAATLALFTLVVLYETVAERTLFGVAFDPEPVAMLLFTVALGWFVLARARERTYAYAALSRELQLAGEIQQSLLPRRMPDVPGVGLEGTYLPMSDVAGDFYDVAVTADGRVIVIVADVSGHGVPAALVASMVKVAFAAEAERSDRPGDILGGINRALTGTFDRAYVTACCLAIDRARQRIACALAGHPPPLLRRRNGRVESLPEGGVVLTMFPQSHYATADVSFEPGDRLLVFTDGLLEAPRRGNDDELFGDAELRRVIAGISPSADMSSGVLRAYRHWMGDGVPLQDDVTLVVVECLDADGSRSADV